MNRANLNISWSQQHSTGHNTLSLKLTGSIVCLLGGVGVQGQGKGNGASQGYYDFREGLKKKIRKKKRSTGRCDGNCAYTMTHDNEDFMSFVWRSWNQSQNHKKMYFFL